MSASLSASVSPWVSPATAAAVLLVVAGLAKVARPTDTGRALALLAGQTGRRLPWAAVVRVGAVIEVGMGLWLLAGGGRPAALAVAASYLAFALFVGGTKLAGAPLATCGCFGEPDTPPTFGHVALCLALAAAVVLDAGLVAGTHPGPAGLGATTRQLHAWAPAFVVLVGAMAYAGYLVMGPGPRLRRIRSHP